MDNKSKVICPYCGCEDTFKYFDAKMPVIESACSKELAEKITIEDIKVNFCNECALGFKSGKFPDLAELYDNYPYISPCSGIGTSKYAAMLECIPGFVKKEEKILEIGCSEGYLLFNLKKAGYRHLSGIEPSSKAEYAAKDLGLCVRRSYFSEKFEIKDKVDVVIMMHVWEHLVNPFAVIRHIRNILSEEGKVIIEVPNFGGYCHQHLFYYSEPFVRILFYDLGFKIIKFHAAEVLRLICQKSDNPPMPDPLTQKEKIHSYREKAIGIQKNFSLNLDKIEKFIADGNGLTYWWGAGSTSVIYLNQIKINNIKDIIMVLDGDNNKVGKFIPGLPLEVHDCNIIKNKIINKIVVASEFVQEIKERMLHENIIYKELINAPVV